MAWNPTQYLKFGSARMRPAVDLLTRASCLTGDVTKVKSVLDLGCGTGNMSELLCRTFPTAKVKGLDFSAEMIERAVADHSKSEFKDRLSWRIGTAEHESKCSEEKHDVVFSNAALHWCTEHKELFPNIIKNMVKPNGGVLAVQIPDTRVQTSHVLMDTAAFRSGMLNKVKHVRIPRVEQDPAWYYTLLSPMVKEIDMWTTEYAQQLPTAAPSYADSHEIGISRHPVLEYTKSTGLLPIIEALGGENSADCQTYLNEYDRLLYDAYPIVKVNNKCNPTTGPTYITIMPFKRFFLVCKL